MEIAIVGATAVVTVEAGSVADARVAITALAPTIRRVPEEGAATRYVRAVEGDVVRGDFVRPRA